MEIADNTELTLVPLDRGAKIRFAPSYPLRRDEYSPPGCERYLWWRVKLDVETAARLSGTGEQQDLHGDVHVEIATVKRVKGSTPLDVAELFGEFLWHGQHSQFGNHIWSSFSVSLFVTPESFDACYNLMVAGRIPDLNLELKKLGSQRDRDRTALGAGYNPDGNGMAGSEGDSRRLGVYWLEFVQPVNSRDERGSEEKIAGIERVTAKQLDARMEEIKQLVLKGGLVIWVLLAVSVVVVLLK